MVNLVTIMSALALAGGSLGFFIFPMGLKMGLRTFINLKENGMVFPIYKAPPFASKSTYYIYELRNPRDFLLGQKMKFKLRGPYIYSAILYRDHIAFSNSQKLVAFHSHRKLFLNEEASENLDEKFWVLNPVVVGVQKSVKDMVIEKVPFKTISEPIVLNSVNVLLDQYKMRLVIKTTPRDLLQGTKIDLLIALTGLAERFGLAPLLPPGPPENMFGVSHAQNHTIDIQEIWTGVGDPDRLAEVNTWRGKSKVQYWRGKCAVINGTNGELYKPFIQAGKPIKIFLGQLCRSFNLDPVDDKPMVIENGLTALEFEISPRLFMGARSNPDNKCFCQDTRTLDCQYDGLISMGPCFFDAPLWFARPNFLGVGREIRSLLNEDTLEYPVIPNKQSFYLDPITGTIVKLNITLTGVFKFTKQKYLRDFTNLRNVTYAPLFAANESIILPMEVAWQLKALQLMYDYHKPGMFIIAATGGAIFLMGRFRRGKIAPAQPAVANPQPVVASPQPAEEQSAP